MRVTALVRHERPAVPTVRLVIAAAVGTGSAALAGSAPASPALNNAVITWLSHGCCHPAGRRARMTRLIRIPAMADRKPGPSPVCYPDELVAQILAERLLLVDEV
jgi:hypothetical protein